MTASRWLDKIDFIEHALRVGHGVLLSEIQRVTSQPKSFLTVPKLSIRKIELRFD